MGTVHGRCFVPVLDSAMGCAVHWTPAAGKAYTTPELKLNLLRAPTAAVPLVRVQAWAVHGGHHVAAAEGQLVGPAGNLYAHASAACLDTAWIHLRPER